MKFVSKILLIILSVPILVLCVLSINVRLQFLSSDFWIGTFEKADVYTQISTSLSSRLLDKVVAGGGKGSDVAVLSSLISPNILKIFFEEKRNRGRFTYNVNANANKPFAEQSIKNARFFLATINNLIEVSHRGD